MKNEIKNAFIGKKTKLLSLLVALCVTTALWASNTITYTALSKLSEPTTTFPYGFNINAFNVPISSHTFSKGIGTITFAGEVTTIGEHAFYWCKGLLSITIPNSVTTIGKEAFYNCYDLQSITIPNSVTTIEAGAFSYCSSLKAITIPNSVTTIGKSAFSGCRLLPVIDNIRYADTYLVETIDKTLSTYTIKEGTKWIGSEAFEYCSGLTSITIPNSVTTIGESAFYGCSGLTSVTIPNSVTIVESSAFGNCTSLPVIDNVRYADTYLVGAIDKTLSTYTIKDGTKWIGSLAFENCYGLTTITIPNSVTTIGERAFSGCRGLTSVTIPNSVITIGESAFFGCISLTSVTIPNSVTTIGNDAFRVCSSLKSITLPNSITTIESYTFLECSALASIAIPSSVTTIEYGAFMKSGLTSIAISSSVNTIGNHAFEGCSNLPSISVDPANKRYASLDGILCNKTKDTLIQYPMGNVRTTYSIPNFVTTIGRRAFFDCTNLLSITIPNSVTMIGDNAFHYVNNIAYNGTATGSPWGAKCVNGYIDGNLVYSDASKTKLCGCSSATIGEVTIPNSVTTIGDYAFYHCNSLTSITIPYSVKRIGDNAFVGCNNLTSITCYATIPPSCMYSFYGLNETIPIYVPAQSVDAYKQADGWKDFTNILPIGTDPTRLEGLTIDNGASAHSNKCTVRKFIRNNQLYIRRGDKLYNAAGQKIQ